MLRAALIPVALLSLSAAHAEDPDWLREARTREGKLVAPHELRSDDGWLSARVPVKVRDVAKLEKSYVVALDVGSTRPAYCEFIPGGFHFADTLRQKVDSTLKELEPIQGKVEGREIEFTDAGSFGEAPYLKASWLYRVNDGKQARLGALKQMVFEKLGHAVYCSHLDIGYVKTFDAATRALAESFDAPAATAPAYFREISVASLAGSRIGISVTTLVHEKDGNTRARQVSAVVIRSASGDVTTQDSVHVERIHPDGALIDALDETNSNGEVSSSMALTRDQARWIVEGEMQGKKVRANLPADAQPHSWIEQSRELRKLLAGDQPVGAVHSIPMWISLDPGNVTDMKTTVLEMKSPNAFTARASAGPLEYQELLDKGTGLPTLSDIPMGPQTLRVERVHLSGSF
ncbi:MAG TPA: hypothetical protein VFL16_11010 [Steroidobacteraceae bacterium]|nr:hypothetical protein [Steroidobacteraceae bacterium]